MATGPSIDRCRYGAVASPLSGRAHIGVPTARGRLVGLQQSRAVGEALPFGDLQRRLVVSTAQPRDPTRLEQTAHDGGVAVESGGHQRG
eukprot:scaffold87121_cov64-Phaeocystis_antarctica.AAC.3